MPLDLNYKNAGAWGPGLGRKLTGVEVDTNFYEVEVAVEALETSRPQPNNITSITTDSTSITFHFQDGTSMGPLPMPILEFRYRGDWAPSTIYQVLDVFIVAEVGEFSVLVDHTSNTVFDQAALDPGGNPLYLLMLPMGSGSADSAAHTVTDIVAASYTLLLTDSDTYIRAVDGLGVAITIPAEAGVAFPLGCAIAFEQAGSGALTIAGGAGVTLHCNAALTAVTNGQFAVAQIKKVGADEWTIFGNLVPA
jgi:hypothetical protein